MRTLWGRLAAIEAEDAFCAYKAVFLACHPDRVFQQCDYDAWRDDVLQLVRHHLPHEMAAKMLLKPLDLQAWIGRAVVPVVATASRRFLVR
jgi:hypothetical protein